MNNNETCKNCKWWGKWDRQPTDKKVIGGCHKLPPQATTMWSYDQDVSFMAEWPENSEEDWCGGFQDNSLYSPVGISETRVSDPQASVADGSGNYLNVNAFHS